MEMKPGYKQTEVGVIPEDWELRPFLSAIMVGSGQVDPKIEPYRSMILVAPDHIESGSGRLLKKETANSQHAISGKYFFGNGNIVYSKIRPYLKKAILADFKGLCSADMYPLKSVPDVSAGFIFFVILGDHFSEYAKSVSVRSGMPKINRSELADYILALPPTKAEQEAIAEALSDADALIESLEKLIAKKRQIKQGAMQELLTGKKRLPGFEKKPGYKQTEVGVIPEDWEVNSIDSFAQVTSGKRLPLGRSLIDIETPHPYIRVADMRPGHVSLADIKFVPVDVFPAIKLYRIFKADIFISVAGTLGIVGKIPVEIDGANLTENADRITSINCSQDYLLYVLMSPLIQNTINSIQTIGAQPKLALTRIRKFLIPLPPTKAEQKAIATILSDMDAEIQMLESKLAKARQIKQGMMQELLTGRIRLI